MYSAQSGRRVVGVLVLVAAAGCNASSLTGTSTPKGLSQSQVSTFVQQMGKAFSNGMQGAHPQLAPAAILRPASKVFASTYPPRISATLVNVSVQQRTTCTAGGYISVTGSMTGSISNTGTGVLFLQVTETINSWACIGGFVMDGDPYLSAAGSFSFLNGQQSSAASISFGGGFRWTGNGGGSCQLNLTMLFYPDGTGHLSGVACGMGVNQTF